MSGLNGAEATKGFIINEIYERQKKNEECGCPFGKVSREKIEELKSNQADYTDFMKEMLLSRNIQLVATIILALLTGADVMGRLLAWLGVLPK